MQQVRESIRIKGELLEDTSRFYEGPTINECLLTAATDWHLAGHFSSVKTAYEVLKGGRLYEVCD